MKAIQITSYQDVFHNMDVVELADPVPEFGEVLIQVEVGSLFPADELILQNNYVTPRTLPFVGGSLGVGRVVSSGGGWWANRLVGKQVYFTPEVDRSGSWAEFAVSVAKQCIVVDGDDAPEQYINLGNSLTAVALVTEAKRRGHTGMVINAAAGSLGRLMNLYAASQRIEVINIIRNDEQKQLLIDQGATQVLSTQDGDFSERLQWILGMKQVRYAVYSLAGEALPELLSALPESSDVQLIGSLSQSNSTLNIMRDVVAKGHQIQGFAVAQYLSQLPLLKLLSLLRESKRFHDAYAGQVPVKNAVDLVAAVKHMPELFKNRTDNLTVVKP